MQGNFSSLFTSMSNKTKDITRVVLDHVENNVFCFYVNDQSSYMHFTVKRFFKVA